MQNEKLIYYIYKRGGFCLNTGNPNLYYDGIKFYFAEKPCKFGNFPIL